MHNEFIPKLLALTAKYEVNEELTWDENLNFFVTCSDCFFHAADAEPITENDLMYLENALIDANKDGMLLYCARKLQLQPLTKTYLYINKINHHLFKCLQENP